MGATKTAIAFNARISERMNKLIQDKDAKFDDLREMNQKLINILSSRMKISLDWRLNLVKLLSYLLLPPISRKSHPGGRRRRGWIIGISRRSLLGQRVTIMGRFISLLRKQDRTGPTIP